MIGRLVEQLVKKGLLSQTGPVSWNAFIRLNNILVNVFDSTGRYLYLRVSEEYDLDAENRIALRVFDAMSHFVPEPLAFLRADALSCIVFEGVEFDVVSPSDVATATSSSVLGRELLDCLGTARAALQRPREPGSVARLREEMAERYSNTSQETLWSRVEATANFEWLESLPSQMQHGDFVPNNFGLSNGKLIVFDWEDFGRIDLPGFDLAVLLGGIVDFNAASLREVVTGSANRDLQSHPLWLELACDRVGVSKRDLFVNLPFYLSLFMWLKDRYSPAIRQKVASAIEGLL